MTIRTRFITWLRGSEVGTDQFGNTYYVDKKDKTRRWVLYKGTTEGSKVPPEWNAWLHHTVDQVPEQRDDGPAWEQEHLPNLTGTDAAYRPSGHVTRGGKRPAATGDYEAWQPE